jgi:hypothetical protein
VAADKKTATALLYFQLYSQRAADKKKGGGKSASAQPIFRIPGRHNYSYSYVLSLYNQK